MLRLIIALGAASLAATPAAAQDFRARPHYGQTSLSAGFLPDPHFVQVQAGGDVRAADIDSSCRGYITRQPTYNVSYRAGSLPLFLSAYSQSDTTLVVNAPDGRWYCNDDGAEGLNPGLTFQSPQSGLYNIWVGTYSSSAGFQPATLYVSELGYGDQGGATPQPGGVLNPSLPANFGSRTLRAGFTPDPYTISVVAGGTISASDAAGSQCRGYVSSAPDFELTYQAGRMFSLYISATSDRDTTLVVNGPDGRWYCNDDAFGLNPGLTFQNPQTGVYDIWVGTYGGGTASAQLHISEVGYGQTPGGGGATPQPGGTLNPSLPANFGGATLRAGFVPDPHSVSIVAGGSINAREAVSQDCRGYVSGAPDYELTYQAGRNMTLYISATSDRDTTLVVNGPDGRWYCNDDAVGLNPGLTFQSARSGVYDIWVGTYGGGTASAQLHISELGYGPRR
ncbi:MAG: hypothetical protein KIS81_11290 [Maricaulaceae bacterium]|nr:hypothetical protein [Maricaulaceae bacterium]